MSRIGNPVVVLLLLGVGLAGTASATSVGPVEAGWRPCGDTNTFGVAVDGTDVCLFFDAIECPGGPDELGIPQPNGPPLLCLGTSAPSVQPCPPGSVGVTANALGVVVYLCAPLPPVGLPQVSQFGCHRMFGATLVPGLIINGPVPADTPAVCVTDCREPDPSDPPAAPWNGYAVTLLWADGDLWSVCVHTCDPRQGAVGLHVRLERSGEQDREYSVCTDP